MISQNSFFGQVCLVFALDSDFDKSLQFLGLDSLDLKSLVLNALANLAAFLEVVEAVLLSCLRVHANLVPNGLGVGTESTMSLLIKLALLVLLLFLFLDYFEELVAFSFRLLGHHHLLFNKLSSASDVKILCISASKIGLCDFISASLTFSFFKCALGSERVDFALTISSALLELSETLDFELLLFLETLSLSCIRFFFGNSLCVVTHNFQIFVTLLTQFILLTIQRNFVGYFNFPEHLLVTGFLCLGYLLISGFLQLNSSHHLSLLALKLLSLLNTHHLTFFDLLNDNSGTTALGFNP